MYASSRGSTEIGAFIDLLRCPATGEPLNQSTAGLLNRSGTRAYPINACGVPLFATDLCTAEARVQQAHYDRIAAAYSANLKYSHTQEYIAYLDRALDNAVGPGDLGVTAELCCGHGEALPLLSGRITRYVGIDVSEKMLDAASGMHANPAALFAQGDATILPLADGCFDTVVLLGGIHHVPDRRRLFGEIARVLKPGGRLLYREPSSDFVLWRAVRAIIYRLSPMLDNATERPLIYAETVPVLQQAGLRSVLYETHGFLGFCLFMNSDVLFFNRLFRFIPGIRALVRGAVRLDRLLLRTSPLRRAGLQVIGIAVKLGAVVP
jgi:ubiquinone/menaquinone biosynthesis C-methylase UbiE